MSTEIRDWIPVIGGAIGTIAAAIGLPKILADRRERKVKAAETHGPATLLPNRIKMVDRVTELAQVLRYLADGEPVVTVEGGRGVGKSALVLEAAHQFATGVDKQGRKAAKPAAALFWIDAGNDSPDLTDVTRKLGLHSGEQSLTTAPTALKGQALSSYLTVNPTVFVVDNLRLPAHGPAPLRDFFQTLPSGSRAIISSNTVGVVDGPRVTVTELAQPDARALVAREAERCNVTNLATADQTLIDRVYRLVGGNPRAIRLLVAACAGQPGTVTELLDEIEAGAGGPDALYDVVWSDLAEPARATLAMCAFLDAGADPGQVSIALDLPEPQAKQALRQLWTDGLVEAGQALGRTVYRCPSALRTFVLGHMNTEELGQARDRLATALAERFGREWEDASGAAAEVETIRTLVEDLAGAGRNRLCLDLFAAVYDMLFTLGLFDDRIKLGWVACRAAEALGSTEEQSLALSVISSTHAIRGENAEAAHAVKVGLDIARRAGAAREIARQLRCEGFRLYRAGHAREALDAVRSEDAEGMARAAGDPNNMIDILSLVGAAQFHLGDIDGCEATVRRFLTECERMPWERGKAYALRDLAEVQLMRGDLRQAEELTARAKAIAAEYRDLRQSARIGLTEARLHLFAGRPRAARDTAVQAARAAGDLQLPGERAEAEAVAAEARRCLWQPWRRVSVTGKPRNRFTDWTIGGD